MPAQIALSMGRSVKTLEAHYHRMKAKLGIASTAQLRQQLKSLR